MHAAGAVGRRKPYYQYRSSRLGNTRYTPVCSMSVLAAASKLWVEVGKRRTVRTPNRNTIAKGGHIQLHSTNNATIMNSMMKFTLMSALLLLVVSTASGTKCKDCLEKGGTCKCEMEHPNKQHCTCVMPSPSPARSTCDHRLVRVTILSDVLMLAGFTATTTGSKMLQAPQSFLSLRSCQH